MAHVFRLSGRVNEGTDSILHSDYSDIIVGMIDVRNEIKSRASGLCPASFCLGYNVSLIVVLIMAR